MVIPPYAPSFAWYVEWGRGVAAGLSDSEAILRANKALHIGGKDFARCLTAGNTGSMTLSVPVAGGSHALRRHGAELTATLSGHGNWRHVHAGAMDAVYGRTPFFQHLMPALGAVLEEEQRSLADLNLAIHHVLAEFLSLPATYGELPESVAERARELSAEIDRSKSLADALMRLGRDTVLALLHEISDGA